MDEDDDLCVAGGVDISEHLINKDVIQFSNYPDDILSIQVLQLIGLHLRSFSDREKYELIEKMQSFLGVKKLHILTQEEYDDIQRACGSTARAIP